MHYIFTVYFKKKITDTSGGCFKRRIGIPEDFRKEILRNIGGILYNAK